MKLLLLVALSAVSLGLSASAATRYVNLNNPSPTAPYTNWTTAATNIQDAIDEAIDRDVILVTNGVYKGGVGSGYYGIIARVAVTKAVHVRSVNGPSVTHIVGQQVPGDVHGEGAMRCVYLASGASLAGFTVTNGATYGSYSDTVGSGGGVWCESVTAVVSNCVLIGNAASLHGGGAYGGTLQNCVLSGNSAPYGGGAFSNTLNNCVLSGNSADENGGGVYGGTLKNCTLTGNSADSGGGSAGSSLTNCIVYFNTARTEGYNYRWSTLDHSCATPLPATGAGNISADPQLASGSHLSASSPCTRAGTPAHATGLDIDGERWATPPSIGCDEYWSGTATGLLSASIIVSYTNVSVGFPLDLEAVIVGRVTASCWDFGDGLVVSNQPYASHAWAAEGEYVVRLMAFNETYPDGVVAALTVRVQTPPVHYVSLNPRNPAPPYTSWETAAPNIQLAVDYTAVPGAMILVSNGVYQVGARAVHGVSNRIVVAKPVTVRSVGGPSVTHIVGYQVPDTTNGPAAIRGAYLVGRAKLDGFTLTNGATQSSSDYKQGTGGGVWCESSSALVTNCVITGNAADSGGGAFRGTLEDCTLIANRAATSGGGVFFSELNNCLLTGNMAQDGGGARLSTLNNCVLVRNSAEYGGGGAYQVTLNNCEITSNSANIGGGAMSATLNNCTVTGNSAGSGGGAAHCTLNNCIIFFNRGDNYLSGSLDYSCTAPLPDSGTGNIAANPQLATTSRLGSGSPCVGAGSASYATGLDIDGEPWAARPSMGCDEPWPRLAAGPLSVDTTVHYTNVAVGFAVDLRATIEGQASVSRWDFGDGVVVSNQPYATHAWQAAGDYLVELRTYNDTNPNGVAATIAIHVQLPQIHYVALGSTNPVAPYSSWETAATNIQHAVDAATVPGAFVLVGDGAYDAGAREVYGISNRVAVTMPLTVKSLNGPAVTWIIGHQLPGFLSGESAIRCAYLSDGASLIGFTLTNGATQSSGHTYRQQSGGGVWCESANVIVSNCVITGNSADDSGGGAFGGTLSRCVLTGNSATYEGGGACGASLSNCSLANNSAISGGGATGSRLFNCTLTANSASFGGGASYSALHNCTLTGNSAENGGGVTYSQLKNCIIYYNTAKFEGDNYYGDYGARFDHCCTVPAPINGVGNFAALPLLAGNARLSPESPCRGAGSSAYASGLDLDGDPWRDPPSVGADEYWSGSATGTLHVRIIVAHTNVAVGVPLDLQAAIQGRPSASRWDFGDGVVASNQPYASHTWKAAGEYLVKLDAFNDSNPVGVAADVIVRVQAEPVHYVSQTSTNPLPPYESWSTAATNIQDAIDASALGALILVSNGVYQTGTRTIDGTINRVAVTKPLALRSVNGPEATHIVGSGNARCVYLVNGASLTGFTLTNGGTMSGGGVWCQSPRATVVNCKLMGNSATYGGGAWGGTLMRCILEGNSAYSGGGACQGTLNNCRLVGNSADFGAGADNSTLNNCTVVGNEATYRGGGVTSGTANNCIIYYNIGYVLDALGDMWMRVYSNYENATLNYSCTTPLPADGAGNLTDEPEFISLNNSTNLHLRLGSPCIDAGHNSYASGPLDLDENNRISGRSVDMGAYEREFLAPESSAGLQAELGSTVSPVGQSGCIPVYLDSTEDLTEVIVTIDEPPMRFGSFTAVAVAPDVESAETFWWEPVLRLKAKSGQVLRGRQHVANLCFNVFSGQPSAFLPLQVLSVRGLRPDGVAVNNNVIEGGGRVIAIGDQPLLEMGPGTHGTALIVYGQPGSLLLVESNPLLDGDPQSWQPAFTVDIPSTNLWQTISLEPTNHAIFYRVRTQ